MKTLSVLIVTAVLAASPAAQADDPTAPRPIQQTLPKSWIPERQPETKDPIVAAPQPTLAPSSITHAPPGLTCPTSHPNRPGKATRDFVEAYAAARDAFSRKRWAEALTLAEAAAQRATSALDFDAVENLRLGAAHALGDTALETTAAKAIKGLGCAPPYSVFTPIRP